MHGKLEIIKKESVEKGIRNHFTLIPKKEWQFTGKEKESLEKGIRKHSAIFPKKAW